MSQPRKLEGDGAPPDDARPVVVSFNGTKVAMDRLTLVPSWLIETSPGNHQAGYLLREPLANGNAADRLMNAIVAARLCDPGANGPRARLARLPVAVNGKYTPPFPCRLAEWRPDLRYSIDGLVAGVQLEMTPSGRPLRQKARTAQDRPRDGDPVWLPRPEENAVLAAIRDGGLYKAPLGDGTHDITCPWVQENTGAADGGTAYFEPDDSWPIGGFKCLHGHCAQRHVRELLHFVGIEPSHARMKPTIRVVAGEMNRVVDAGERELAHSGRHYQRGGLIVTVVTDPGTRETRVQDISPPARVRALSGAATWSGLTAAPKTGCALTRRPAMRPCCSTQPATTTCRCQPGCKSHLQYADAEYFGLSLKDARVATARREKPVPTLEQIRRTIALTPGQTEIDRRNRALMSFALLTGARDNVLASMKLKHVDPAAGSVFQDARDVNTKFSKSFTTSFFPVGGEARQIFDVWVKCLRKDKL